MGGKNQSEKLVWVLSPPETKNHHSGDALCHLLAKWCTARVHFIYFVPELCQTSSKKY